MENSVDSAQRAHSKRADSQKGEVVFLQNEAHLVACACSSGTRTAPPSPGRGKVDLRGEGLTLGTNLSSLWA